MKRRKRDAKTKAAIVLQGLKGQAVANLCTDHQISQARYYQWRDQLLMHAGQAFEIHQHSQRESRLQQENARLKQVVGALTLQFKKIDEVRCGNDPASVGLGAFSLLRQLVRYPEGTRDHNKFCIPSPRELQDSLKPLYMALIPSFSSLA